MIHPVAVIIPVLGRPERVEPLLSSLYGSERDVELRPLFVVSPGDEAEESAVRESGADWMLMPKTREPGDYARKINRAFVSAWENGVEWVFMGADDLCFCEGWADVALEVAAATPTATVIGTNDLGNPAVTTGQHATHSLVRGSYLEAGTIDETGKLLHEGYRHNWVDNEFVATARHRGVFVFAAGSYVEHLHPAWGKAEDDAIYQLGLADFNDDRLLFRNRESLWA